jgi:hypothetical protein
MLKILKIFAGVVVLLIIISKCTKNDAPNSTPQQSTITVPVVRACETGNPTEARYFINKKDTPFYLYPDKKKGRVVNARASAALKQNEYRNLWPEMALQGLCETQDWLQAKIVEADGSPVDWESGWVEKSKVHTSSSNEHNAGLIWNIDGESDFTAKEKALVKEGALKVLRDEPNCSKITYGDRSTSKKGEYFVTCDARNGGGPLNVWFSPSDVKNNRTLAIPTAFPEAQSRQLCIDAIKNRVNHPSTLNIHSITGYSTRVANNGNREVIQTFSAKNSFGLELKNQARCLIMPNGKLEITITEQP